MCGSSQKQMTKLADLNYFLKSIEKEVSEQYKHKGSIPSTPNALLRKVEDHMKAFGYDKNNCSNPNLAALLQNIDQTASAESFKKSLPQLKALKEAIYS